MKKLFTLFAAALLLAAPVSLAQNEPQTPEDFHFYMTDAGLVWQMTFAAPEGYSSEVVEQNLLRIGGFYKIEVFDSYISCDFNNMKMDFKAAGYRHADVPIYISNDTFSGHVVIQMKEDRYRVTVSRVVGHHYHYGDADLADFAIKGGSFNRRFALPAGKVIDYNFQKLFNNLGTNRYGDDEW